MLKLCTSLWTTLRAAAAEQEGLDIAKLYNQSGAIVKKAYANRGAETMWNVRRLITDKLLNLQNVSSKTKRQLSARYYTYKDGKIQLEDKTEFRARMGFSPDHADAMVLAHAQCNFYVIKKASAEVKKNPSAAINLEYFKRYLTEIYGTADTNRANNGAYRTGGTYGRRQLGSKVWKSNH